MIEPNIVSSVAQGEIDPAIAPVIAAIGQDLTVFEKSAAGVSQEFVCNVLYVNLRGEYGVLEERGS